MYCQNGICQKMSRTSQWFQIHILHWNTCCKSEKIVTQSMMQKIPCKTFCWSEKVPYQLIIDKRKQWWACGCYVFLLSRWKHVAAFSLLLGVHPECLHPYSWQQSKVLWSQACTLWTKGSFRQSEIYWFLVFADDADRCFAWSSWRVLNGQRNFCESCMQYSGAIQLWRVSWQPSAENPVESLESICWPKLGSSLKQ